MGSMFRNTAVLRVKFRWGNHGWDVVQSSSGVKFAERALETINR